MTMLPMIASSSWLPVTLMTTFITCGPDSARIKLLLCWAFVADVCTCGLPPRRCIKPLPETRSTACPVAFSGATPPPASPAPREPFPAQPPQSQARRGALHSDRRLQRRSPPPNHRAAFTARCNNSLFVLAHRCCCRRQGRRARALATRMRCDSPNVGSERRCYCCPHQRAAAACLDGSYRPHPS